MQELQDILTGLGFEPELLSPDRRLRAELALSSAETTELGLELERRFGARIDLWDAHDYTLAELAAAVDEGSRTPTGDGGER
ncbi:acyl carrier protein [Streptomyces albus]|uniref:Acyl carrier protein n=2 Tax=Streptomyces TaxID=1883 RepID=A0A6C1CA61_9ACTN|nr:MULTISPECIES: acyl carrier protein [Streptomyces]MDI6412561.1 acyl carrier protein [Streptomyces albus]QID39858.1 acyl carrier protein [Streptomyces albus]TGG79688.1 acyl carrier protein [Streptomyces albus]UVN58689.1 acyl carrier protein [Streptomyces albus]